MEVAPGVVEASAVALPSPHLIPDVVESDAPVFHWDPDEDDEFDALARSDVPPGVPVHTMSNGSESNRRDSDAEDEREGLNLVRRRRGPHTRRQLISDDSAGSGNRFHCSRDEGELRQ